MIFKAAASETVFYRPDPGAHQPVCRDEEGRKSIISFSVQRPELSFSGINQLNVKSSSDPNSFQVLDDQLDLQFVSPDPALQRIRDINQLT